jgi:hypothetical protein
VTTRAEALTAAADIINRQVPDLRGLVSLLEAAGQRRLCSALRLRLAAMPAEVGGAPKPDPQLWLAGRIK